MASFMEMMESAEQYIRQALKTRALLLKEFAVVKIAGLIVELLYGIFSLLSHKSGMVTVESLRDYVRKAGDYCVTSQPFMSGCGLVRLWSLSEMYLTFLMWLFFWPKMVRESG